MPYANFETRKKYNASYYERYKDRMRAYQKDYRENQIPKYLHSAVKARAKKEGIPFSIEVSDIIIPKYCPVLNIELVRGNRGFCDTAPSIDKVYPDLGYVKGNIEIMSYKANRAKSNLTLDELIMLGEWAKKTKDKYGGTDG